MPTPPKLTERQERFCLEWLTTRNATRSAIEAGYSERSAYSTGHRLLKNAEIIKRIRRLQKGQAKRLQITADRIMNEYARLAFSDVGSVANWGEKGVRFLDRDEIGKDARRAISEISSETRKITLENGGEQETTTLKIKLHPKLPALDKLAKLIGLADDDAASGGIEVNINVEDYKRPDSP